MPQPQVPVMIISVTFDRVGMDTIGPLPKSSQGHEYILVTFDYAMCYRPIL